MDADEFLGQVAAPGEHLGIGSSAAAGCCCGGCHGGIFSRDEWHIYHGNKNLNRRTRWAGKKRRHRREKVSKMKATLRGQAGAVPITVNSGNVAGAATRRFDLRNDAPDFGAQFAENESSPSSTNWAPKSGGRGRLVLRRRVQHRRTLR